MPSLHYQAPSIFGSKSITPKDEAKEFDYTDSSAFETTGKVACLLCQRQFKTQDVLGKHVLQSDLHKARLFLWGSYLGYHTMSSWVQGCFEWSLTLFLHAIPTFIHLYDMHYPCSAGRVSDLESKLRYAIFFLLLTG
jgi:hypothetical protein